MVTYWPLTQEVGVSNNFFFQKYAVTELIEFNTNIRKKSHDRLF